MNSSWYIPNVQEIVLFQITVIYTVCTRDQDSARLVVDVISFSPQPSRISTIITVLQVRKWRLRGTEELAQGYVACFSRTLTDPTAFSTDMWVYVRQVSCPQGGG